MRRKYLKKMAVLAISFSVMMALSGCGNKETNTVDSKKDDITTESTAKDSEGSTNASENTTVASADEDTGITSLGGIKKATRPKEILKSVQIFSIKVTYANTGNATLDGSFEENRYGINGSIYEINNLMTYSDGYINNSFFSTDENDTNFYTYGTAGARIEKLESGYAMECIEKSALGYDDFTDMKVADVKDEDGKYIITLDLGGDENDVVTIDKTTERVINIVSTYPNQSGGESTCTYEFDYSDMLTIDYSPMIKCGAADDDGTIISGEEVTEHEITEAVTTEVKDIPMFNTVDINGNPVDATIIKDAKVVMLNMWEPWCGPCVGEMPDLQKLYEKYKDKGLVIVGAYQTFDMDKEAKEIVEDDGITYPIIKVNDEMAKLEQDYVPATFFLDSDGNVLTSEPYAGSRDYSEWEKIIKSYLD